MTQDGPQEIRDSVDVILDQWRRERPDLAVAPVGVVTRLARVRTHLDASLAKVFAGFDLTPADFQVLVNLRRVGAPYQLGQARLMDALGLTSGTVSVRLGRLEQHGIVVREPDEQDKRSYTVRLTARGLQLFDQVAPIHLASEDVLLSALTAAEQEQLANLLRKLLVSFEHSGPRAARLWGMTLEPSRIARQSRGAVGLSDHAGLLVTHVAPDGPAAHGGIRTGDLLTHRAGVEVRTCEDLAAPDSAEVVELRLLRGDHEVEAVLHVTADPLREDA